MRKILEIYAEEEPDPGEEDAGIAESHCFHLMEITRILKGNSTCGVYDEFGK